MQLSPFTCAPNVRQITERFSRSHSCNLSRAMICCRRCESTKALQGNGRRLAPCTYGGSFLPPNLKGGLPMSTNEVFQLCLVIIGICNGIFNHTLLCEFHQGKLLLHLTIPFEEKTKTNLPSDNLKYYRQRNQMTTRQLAEKLDIVPSTVVMYENGKHPIPYDVAIKLADVLEIEVSLLYDDFSRFLSAPIPKR